MMTIRALALATVAVAALVAPADARGFRFGFGFGFGFPLPLPLPIVRTGAILVCNELGCRSIVEYRPPIAVGPPVIYMPPPGQEQRYPAAPPTYIPPLANVPPAYPVYDLDRPPIAQGRPPMRSPGVALVPLPGRSGQRASGPPNGCGPTRPGTVSRCVGGHRPSGREGYPVDSPSDGQGRPPIENNGVQATPLQGRSANAPTGSARAAQAEVIKEAEGIEGDITAFCDSNPETPFCGKLGDYLRRHPRKPTEPAR